MSHHASKLKKHFSFAMLLVIMAMALFVLLSFMTKAVAQTLAVGPLKDIDSKADTVAENSPIDTPVGITARADNSTAYTLIDSAGGLFAIDRQSGIVTVAMNTLDYEAFSSHTIVIQASNDAASLTSPFTIHLTDVAEPISHIADIDLSPNKISYGSMRGDAVGITARATDPDQGSVVRYSLSEDEDGRFTIGEQDGIVTLTSDSYASDQDYLIEVTARSDDGTSSSAQFTVRPDTPIRIVLTPEELSVREGESQGITFSFTRTDLEVKGISAGGYHNCAITAANGAVCWGSNTVLRRSGEVFIGQSAPPPGRTLIAISAGTRHTCGITAANGAVCWGSNTVLRGSGEVFIGQSTPPPDRKFIAISAGGSHSCALTASNDAVCWGDNTDRQSAPPSDRTLIAISAGSSHTCGITTGNKAICWGSDKDIWRSRVGQSTPPPGRKFIAISAGGFHTCGITTGNDAVCWGSNAGFHRANDQVGQSAPPSGRKFIAVSAGAFHSCGITLDNGVVCWGSNRDSARDLGGQSTPPSGRKFIAVSAGAFHSCGITLDNGVVCWGDNDSNVSTPPQMTPIAAESITITATVLDADREQISLSDNGQTVIPAGETQTILTVSAADDNINEPETDHTIALGVAGHATLARDEITITIPADNLDPVEDVDSEADEVAENSPIGAPVGITVRSAGATAYTLTEDAGGRFTINADSGLVTVADSGLLNFEEATTHGIIARVSDAVKSQTIAFVIQITDVDEPIRHITDIDLSPNKISYGSMRGDEVGITARAVDPDQGSVVRYSLSEDEDGRFTIGEQDGIVTLASNDYEADQDYLIEVTAESSDMTSKTAQFTVKPDTPIRITPSPVMLTIREEEPQDITFSFAETDFQVKSVSAARYHSCAITADNDAACWGSDSGGLSAPPADKKFIAVSASQSLSCGITASNEAVCWGPDDFNQDAQRPDTKFIAISVGFSHSCGITINDETVCWGSGTGGSANPPPDRLVMLSAGSNHSCGITHDNDAVCWGSDSNKQSSPPSGRKFIDISASFNHTCGITLDNKAACWGSDSNGQSSPPSNRKFIAVSAGALHSCGITLDNDAVCWGDPRNNRIVPPSDSKFIAVSAGFSHSCGVTLDNKVACWGDNGSGQGAPPDGVTPLAADPITITATVANADGEQLNIGGNGRAVIPAGETRAALTVAVGDNYNEGFEYIIGLNLEGQAELTEDRATVFIPAENRVTNLRDIDGEPGGAVPEGSPVDTEVGITARADNAATYSLTDNADGRFAVNAQSGTVSVAMDVLDHEASSSHSITAQATNATNSRTINLVIRVTNVPEPLGRVADIDISPDRIIFGSTRGDTVGVTARATDPDPDSSVSYSLTEDSNGLFAIGEQNGVVTLASGNYVPDQDYLIEVTARSNDGTSSSARFTVRRDAPIRIALTPLAAILEEGESQEIAFSFTKADLDLKAISAGFLHSCAITTDNRAICWGTNVDGDNNHVGQTRPIPKGRYVAISAGQNHSCGITTSNDAVCWGSDFYGQSSPPSNRKFIAISAGILHSCGITASNEAVCWGYGTDGRSTPPPNRKFIAISAASSYTCGITTRNEVLCWGSDEDGRRSLPPESVNRRFIAISAGNGHSCGIATSNEAVCWGRNTDGQSAPPSGSKFIAISAAGNHTCGITTGNDAVCWGDNFFNQALPSNRKFIAISAGRDHTCGITAGNEAVCRGGTRFGQITPPQITPLAADSIAIAAAAANAGREQLNISGNGRVVIPAGSTQAILTVTAIDDDIREPETDYTIDLSVNGNATLEHDEVVITVPADVGDTVVIAEDIDSADNTVAENSPIGTPVGITAQAGNSTAYTLTDSAGGLFAINPQSGVVTVAIDALDYEAFSSHSITVQASDEVSNRTASFVINVTDEPEPVSRITDIDFSPNKIVYGAMPGAPVGITARAVDQDQGSVVSYSLTNDADGLFVIGQQDGIVTLASDNYDPEDYRIEVTARSSDKTSSAAQFTVRADEPIRIAPSPIRTALREGESQDITFSFAETELEVKDISAGQFHSCAISFDNRAICWGDNSDGQSTPPTGKKFIAISSGILHSCGITASNEAVCWGGENQITPIVAPSNEKFIAISSGASHSCGITTDNNAVCWGSNGNGRSAPPSDRKFIAISAGERHSCGITTGNEAVCWGDNTTNQRTPPSNRKFIAISAGWSHSCAITTTNDAICWGDNIRKQSMPTPDKKFIAVSAGIFHSCGITASNEAVCWGTDTFRSTMPPTNKKFIEVSAGGYHSCGITTDNEAVCWGSNTRDKQVNQSTPPQITPTVADTVTITAIPSDKEQIRLNTQELVIAAGQTQTALNITAIDDYFKEPETTHTVDLGVSGHATLEEDQLIVTVLVDDRDTGDIDRADNAVAENSPVGAPVGITAQANNATAYTLSDSAGGLFAIDPQSGTVTVAIDALDYEAFSSHSITVQAGDNVDSQALTFVIQVTDEPEPIRPVADIDFNPNKISYGAMRGDTVGITARAVDQDQGSVVSYSLTDNAGGRFTIGEQDGVVTLASDDHKANQDYPIEVTAESDDNTSSAAQFTIRPDEPIRIALAPTTATLEEGESQDITFSFAETELELKGISVGQFHSCGITPGNDAACWGLEAGVWRALLNLPQIGKVIAISVGTHHNCAITVSNDAVCWGLNAVRTPDGKFIAISAGSGSPPDVHSCGITTNNDAVCWGANGSGQSAPPSGRKFIAVGAGDTHSCGITTSNDAVCWGTNGSGQSAPPSGRKFIAISAGAVHSCGIATNNDAVCWGSDTDIRSTENVFVGQSLPPSGKKFIAISAGDTHSCGITFDNGAVCWGNNDFGQSFPPSGKKFIAVGAGRNHNCGITANNTVVCWGDNGVGQSTPPQITPTVADTVTITAIPSDKEQISLNTQELVIAAGQTQTALNITAIDDYLEEPETTHTVDLGVSGHATLEEDQIIVTVLVDDRDARDIDRADNAVAENSPVGAPVGITAQANNATAYTLSDSAGGLFAIDPQSGVVTVAIDALDYEAFSSHSITVQAGDNVDSQALTFVIQVTDEPEPIRPVADIDFNPNKISYGAMRGDTVGITARAVDQDQGSVVSYSLTDNAGGRFVIGQQDGIVALASDNYGPRSDYLIEVAATSSDDPSTSRVAQFIIRPDRPLRIAPSPITSTLSEGESQDITFTFSFAETELELKGISVGQFHSCGIAPDNDAVCWGFGAGVWRALLNLHQIGKVIAISVGTHHNCAITASNDAVCWGLNAVRTPGGKFIAISAGSGSPPDVHSCGITTSNDAVCWRHDIDTRSTEGVFVGQSSPPSDKKFIAVGAGRSYSCGITTSNEVACWGSDDAGQSSPPSNRKFSAISVGQNHSCGITLDNDAVCWGSDMDTRSTEDVFVGQSSPPSGKKFIAVSAGFFHSCGITTGNEVACWGSDGLGQSSPPSDKKFIAVGAGRSYSCGITANNTVVCWGDNGLGQSTPPQITPTVADTVTITAIPSDKEQISLNTQELVIAAGQTQTALNITAIDDYFKEPETTHTVDLGVSGHATLEEDQLIVTVLVDDRDTGDIDRADNAVAENSPVGAPVGITAQANNATAYTLSDSAGGLFAIDPQSGTVTVAIDALDYEAFSSHSITVQAGDNVDSQALTFVIQVTDEPEPIRPVADIDFNPNKISYGAMRGDTVGITARAVDQDQGSVVSYSLTDNAGGRFTIGEQDGVVTLASDDHKANQDYPIEVTAESDDNTSSAAQFTIRPDEPIHIALTPVASTVKEGESQDILFSFAKTDLEVKGISAGGHHSCAITSDNRAVCWGDNQSGQATPPSDKKFIAVSAGGEHSCGITFDNNAVCWGNNGNDQATPPSGKKFIALSAGFFHSCGITFDNNAVCWGNNGNDQATPPSGKKFIAVRAGFFHSCGITTSNSAVCWGGDSFGLTMPPANRKFVAIGFGAFHSCGITFDNKAVCWGNNSDKQSTPPSDRKFIAISAGSNHSCGITTGNEAVCWGLDNSGSTAPPSGKKFIAISAGGFHSCGITTANRAVCWGANRARDKRVGQSTPPRLPPIAADSITIAATVSDADREQLSISGNGQAVIPSGSTQVTLTVSVGDDDIREPEIDYIINLSVAGHAALERNAIVITVPVDHRDTMEDIDNRPDEVPENSPIGTPAGITVRVSSTSTYALIDSADGLFAINPQSGIVTVAMDMLDYEVSSSHRIITQAQIHNAARSMSMPHIIGVSDMNEPVGPVTDIDSSPDEISYGSTQGDTVGIIARAADPDRASTVTYELSENPDNLFTIGRRNGIVTLASGDYDSGQDYLIEVTARSNGSLSSARFTIRQEKPIRIVFEPQTPTIREGQSEDIIFSLDKAFEANQNISAGGGHSCAITSDNRAVCWGHNDHGQSSPTSSPQDVDDNTRFFAVSAGARHSCAITSDNRAVCWGDNSGERATPSTGKKFISVSAGGSHSCGITTGNDAVCWGSDSPDSAMPPSGRKFIAISAGGSHSCGITTGNDVVCWGLDSPDSAMPPSGSKFIAISAGGNHSCGITTGNEAVCWGLDNSGSTAPPSGRKFIAISAGGSHSCGITTGNEAVCWGLDNSGSTAPPSGRKFIAISAGGSHSCGITTGNTVVCWGSNMSGQRSPPQITPMISGPIAVTAIVSDTDKEKISVSNNNQAVILAGQTQFALVVSVDDNDLRESTATYIINLELAGNATLATTRIVVTVPVDDRDSDIDGTDNTVAENSPVGATVGITAQVESATTYTLSDSAGGLFAIGPQSGIVTVAIDMLDYEAFSSHSITVLASDDASSRTASFVIQVTDEPEPVSPIIDIDFSPNKIIYGSMPGAPVGITARASDQDHGSVVSYSLTDAADGLFIIGQQDGVVTLARNYDPNQDYPIEIEIRAMSNDNTSSSAQFTVRQDEPIRIALTPTTSTLREGESQDIVFSFTETDLEVKDIATGTIHSCAVTSDGRAVCWGDNSVGQSTPPSDRKFIAISAGGRNTCGITTSNDAVCWGDTGSDQHDPPPSIKYIAISVGVVRSCGITTSNDVVCWGLSGERAAPPSDRKYIAISVGYNHGCGITPGNDAVCWRDNSFGQSSPSSGRKYVAISAGRDHSCGITLSNDAVCWGDNSHGQSAPPSDSRFIAVNAGAGHSCGITFDNDAACWGDDQDGQSSPPSDRKFIAISAGEFHSCGITASNEAVCWGDKTSLVGIMPEQVTPIAADSITITATVSDADREQLSVSGNGQAVVPSGSTQITLAVRVVKDDVAEPEATYTIALSAAGHAALRQDEFRLTVPGQAATVTVTQDELRLREGETTTLVLLKALELGEMTTITLTPDGAIDVTPTRLVLDSERTERSIAIEALNNDMVSLIKPALIRLEIIGGRALLSSTQIQIAIEDNDEYQAGFTMGRVVVDEGESVTATLSVAPTPIDSDWLMVELINSDQGQLSLSSTRAMLISGRSSVTVTVTAADDEQREGREIYFIDVRIMESNVRSGPPR